MLIPNLSLKKISQIPLSDSVKSIILGSLLGDGSLRKAKGYKNVRFSFRHSQVQEEYFLWKAQALQEISSPCSVQKQKADGYSKNEKLLFQSCALEELNDLYNIVCKKKCLQIRRK